MTRPLKLTTGKTSRSGQVRTKVTTWDDLAKRLSKFDVLNVTMAKYAGLTVDEKGELKNKTGFFIGGWFSDGTRKKASLLGRSVLTLDVDYLPAYELEGVRAVLADYAYVMHSSASHRPQKPKFRLVLPFTRDITIAEYEPIARKVASWLSIDSVDKVSYRPSQLMYYPARCSDGEQIYQCNAGKWLDPDEVLNSYDNWHDFGSWPVSSSEDGARVAAATMEDPLQKGGMIGAFCRAYDIHEAIREFDLPYTPTESENRYTPAGATGSQGAVVYPSETCDAAFLYSHHSHDIAANRCLNAFDLVRHCRWPKASDEESMRQMIALAQGCEPVKEIQGENLLDKFEDLGPEPETERDEKVKSEKLNYEVLAKRLEDLGNDPHVKDFDWLRKQTRNFVRSLAGARLAPSDEDILLGTLRDTYPQGTQRPSKLRLHADIQQLRKTMAGKNEDENGTVTDIQIDIIHQCLAKHYADGKHIRRVGRSFWVYENGCWRTTEDEQVRGRLIDTITVLRTERPEDAVQLVAAVGEQDTSSIVSQLFSMLPSFIARKHSDRDPLGLRSERAPIVNVLNGELHLVDGHFILQPHNADNFLTAQIPVNYDPDATCPEWNSFCEYVFSDCLDPDRMQKHLEELGGYLVQPTRFLRTWVLFHGPTAAGKTTIGRVFSNLLGGSAVMRPVSSYDGRNSHAEAGLVGRLMLLDEDFDKGAILPDGFLKKISEAKELTANPKNKDEFSFICRALPIIISNSWPATRDASDALIDRALVWDFTQQFGGSQRDDHKADVMTRVELPGILNKFLTGFERLRERGAWKMPLECIVARDMWVAHSNAVGRFILDCVEKDAKERTRANDLWDTYRTWMNDSMPGMRKVGRNEFYERCDQMIGIRSKITGEWLYKGVKLRADVGVSF